jgi:hypothetical protein
MKKLFILLSIGLVIFLLIQFPHAMINPGELTEGHQKMNNECLTCHKPFGGIENDKCISCHKLSEIGKDSIFKKNRTLFHQQLSNQECSSCHTDHQGRFPEHSLSGFKHDLLSVSTLNNCSGCHDKPKDNLHLQVASNCNGCHQSESWKNSLLFNHDVLLNKSNCASCHQKPTDNYHSLMIQNCEKCHSNKNWVPSTFDHSSYFLLDQNHNTTCNTCHTKNNFQIYSCFGCHEHSENNIIAEHNEEGVFNISNCVSCHKSGNEHDVINNDKNVNKDENNKLKKIYKNHDRNEKETD